MLFHLYGFRDARIRKIPNVAYTPENYSSAAPVSPRDNIAACSNRLLIRVMRLFIGLLGSITCHASSSSFRCSSMVNSVSDHCEVWRLSCVGRTSNRVKKIPHHSHSDRTTQNLNGFTKSGDAGKRSNNGNSSVTEAREVSRSEADSE